MTLSSPPLMFEHGLDAKKGWFDMSSLDFSAKLSANVTFVPPAGRVAHITTVSSAIVFEMGVSGTQMPIFLINGQADFDVNNPGTTPSGLFVHRAIGPTGVMTGLVATGGYELSTTEYDTAQTYSPNDLLTATASNTVIATGGVLTNVGTGSHGNVKQYVDPVCGVVSTGAGKNHNNVNQISFWSYFLPGAYV